MSSHASSSGIESDTDSSLSCHEDKDRLSQSDPTNKLHDKTITNSTDDDDEDEGFYHLDDSQSSRMSDDSKPNRYSSSHYPHSTRNPYEDDSSPIDEDWDAECQLIEPYYYPSYIRRAQWPYHWRWTPPLGLRRSCTQELHRNMGFEPSGLYDDLKSSSSIHRY